MAESCTDSPRAREAPSAVTLEMVPDISWVVQHFPEVVYKDLSKKGTREFSDSSHEFHPERAVTAERCDQQDLCDCLPTSPSRLLQHPRRQINDTGPDNQSTNCRVVKSGDGTIAAARGPCASLGATHAQIAHILEHTTESTRVDSVIVNRGSESTNGPFPPIMQHSQEPGKQGLSFEGGSGIGPTHVSSAMADIRQSRTDSGMLMDTTGNMTTGSPGHRSIPSDPENNPCLPLDAGDRLPPRAIDVTADVIPPVVVNYSQDYGGRTTCGQHTCSCCGTGPTDSLSHQFDDHNLDLVHRNNQGSPHNNHKSRLCADPGLCSTQRPAGGVTLPDGICGLCLNLGCEEKKRSHTDKCQGDIHGSLEKYDQTLHKVVDQTQDKYKSCICDTKGNNTEAKLPCVSSDGSSHVATGEGGDVRTTKFTHEVSEQITNEQTRRLGAQHVISGHPASVGNSPGAHLLLSVYPSTRGTSGLDNQEHLPGSQGIHASTITSGREQKAPSQGVTGATDTAAVGQNPQIVVTLSNLVLPEAKCDRVTITPSLVWCQKDTRHSHQGEVQSENGPNVSNSCDIKVNGSSLKCDMYSADITTAEGHGGGAHQVDTDIKLPRRKRIKLTNVLKAKLANLLGFSIEKVGKLIMDKDLTELSIEDVEEWDWEANDAEDDNDDDRIFLELTGTKCIIVHEERNAPVVGQSNTPASSPRAMAVSPEALLDSQGLTVVKESLSEIETISNHQEIAPRTESRQTSLSGDDRNSHDNSQDCHYVVTDHKTAAEAKINVPINVSPESLNNVDISTADIVGTVAVASNYVMGTITGNEEQRDDILTNRMLFPDDVYIDDKTNMAMLKKPTLFEEGVCDDEHDTTEDSITGTLTSARPCETLPQEAETCRTDDDDGNLLATRPEHEVTAGGGSPAECKSVDNEADINKWITGSETGQLTVSHDHINMAKVSITQAADSMLCDGLPDCNIAQNSEQVNLNSCVKSDTPDLIVSSNLDDQLPQIDDKKNSQRDTPTCFKMGNDNSTENKPRGSSEAKSVKPTTPAQKPGKPKVSGISQEQDKVNTSNQKKVPATGNKLKTETVDTTGGSLRDTSLVNATASGLDVDNSMDNGSITGPSEATNDQITQVSEKQKMSSIPGADVEVKPDNKLEGVNDCVQSGYGSGGQSSVKMDNAEEEKCTMAGSNEEKTITQESQDQVKTSQNPEMDAKELPSSSDDQVAEATGLTTGSSLGGSSKGDHITSTDNPAASTECGTSQGPTDGAQVSPGQEVQGMLDGNTDKDTADLKSGTEQETSCQTPAMAVNGGLTAGEAESITDHHLPSTTDDLNQNIAGILNDMGEAPLSAVLPIHKTNNEVCVVGEPGPISDESDDICISQDRNVVSENTGDEDIHTCPTDKDLVGAESNIDNLDKIDIGPAVVTGNDDRAIDGDTVTDTEKQNPPPDILEDVNGLGIMAEGAIRDTGIPDMADSVTCDVDVESGTDHRDTEDDLGDSANVGGDVIITESGDLAGAEAPGNDCGSLAGGAVRYGAVNETDAGSVDCLKDGALFNNNDTQSDISGSDVKESEKDATDMKPECESNYNIQAVVAVNSDISTNQDRSEGSKPEEDGTVCDLGVCHVVSADKSETGVSLEDGFHLHMEEPCNEGRDIPASDVVATPPEHQVSDNDKYPAQIITEPCMNIKNTLPASDRIEMSTSTQPPADSAKDDVEFPSIVICDESEAIKIKSDILESNQDSSNVPNILDGSTKLCESIDQSAKTDQAGDISCIDIDTSAEKAVGANDVQSVYIGDRTTQNSLFDAVQSDNDNSARGLLISDPDTFAMPLEVVEAVHPDVGSMSGGGAPTNPIVAGAPDNVQNTTIASEAGQQESDLQTEEIWPENSTCFSGENTAIIEGNNSSGGEGHVEITADASKEPNPESTGEHSSEGSLTDGLSSGVSDINMDEVQLNNRDAMDDNDLMDDLIASSMDCHDLGDVTLKEEEDGQENYNADSDSDGSSKADLVQPLSALSDKTDTPLVPADTGARGQSSDEEDFTGGTDESVQSLPSESLTEEKSEYDTTESGETDSKILSADEDLQECETRISTSDMEVSEYDSTEFGSVDDDENLDKDTDSECSEKMANDMDERISNDSYKNANLTNLYVTDSHAKPSKRTTGTCVFSQTGATTQLPEGITDFGCQAQFSDDSDYPYYYHSSSQEGTPDRDLGSRGGQGHITEGSGVGVGFRAGQGRSEFVGSGGLGARDGESNVAEDSEDELTSMESVMSSSKGQEVTVTGDVSPEKVVIIENDLQNKEHVKHAGEQISGAIEAAESMHAATCESGIVTQTVAHEGPSQENSHHVGQLPKSNASGLTGNESELSFENNEEKTQTILKHGEPIQQHLHRTLTNDLPSHEEEVEGTSTVSLQLSADYLSASLPGKLGRHDAPSENTAQEVARSDGKNVQAAVSGTKSTHASPGQAFPGSAEGDDIHDEVKAESGETIQISTGLCMTYGSPEEGKGFTKEVLSDGQQADVIDNCQIGDTPEISSYDNELRTKVKFGDTQENLDCTPAATVDLITMGQDESKPGEGGTPEGVLPHKGSQRGAPSPGLNRNKPPRSVDTTRKQNKDGSLDKKKTIDQVIDVGTGPGMVDMCVDGHSVPGSGGRNVEHYSGAVKSVDAADVNRTFNHKKNDKMPIANAPDACVGGSSSMGSRDSVPAKPDQLTASSSTANIVSEADKDKMYGKTAQPIDSVDLGEAHGKKETMDTGNLPGCTATKPASQQPSRYAINTPGLETPDDESLTPGLDLVGDQSQPGNSNGAVNPDQIKQRQSVLEKQAKTTTDKPKQEKEMETEEEGRDLLSILTAKGLLTADHTKVDMSEKTPQLQVIEGKKEITDTENDVLTSLNNVSVDLAACEIQTNDESCGQAKSEDTGQELLAEIDVTKEIITDNLGDMSGPEGIKMDINTLTSIQSGFDLEPVKGLSQSMEDEEQNENVCDMQVKRDDNDDDNLCGSSTEDEQSEPDRKGKMKGAPESLPHEIMKHASREDGGECLYIPDDAPHPPSTVPHELDSVLSPDSGVDDLTESEAAYSDLDSQKSVLSPKRLRLGTTSGSTTPEALSEVFSPDEQVVAFPSCDLPAELLPQKGDVTQPAMSPQKEVGGLSMEIDSNNISNVNYVLEQNHKQDKFGAGKAQNSLANESRSTESGEQGMTIVASFGKRRKGKTKAAVEKTTAETQFPDKCEIGTSSLRDELVESGVGGESRFSYDGDVSEVEGQPGLIRPSQEATKTKYEACMLNKTRKEQRPDFLDVKSNQFKPKSIVDKDHSECNKFETISKCDKVCDTNVEVGDSVVRGAVGVREGGEGPITEDEMLIEAVWEAERNLLDLFGVKPPERVKFQPEPTELATPTGYEDIRELDHLEDWKERVTVVTKLDHEQYTSTVKEVLDELIDNLPILAEESTTTESDNSPLPDTSVETTENQDVSSNLETENLLELESVPTLNSTYTAEPEALDIPESETTNTVEPEAVVLVADQEKEDKGTTDQEPATEPESFTDQEPATEPQSVTDQEPTTEPQLVTEKTEQLAPEPEGTAGDSPAVEPPTGTTDSDQSDQLNPPAEGTLIDQLQPEQVVTPVVEPATSGQPEPDKPATTQEALDSEALPLATGSYNIDWDNFDDSIDPFATKTKIIDTNSFPVACKEPSDTLPAACTTEAKPEPELELEPKLEDSPAPEETPLEIASPTEELVSVCTPVKEALDSAEESKTDEPIELAEKELDLLLGDQSDLLQTPPDLLSEPNLQTEPAPEPESVSEPVPIDPFETSLLSEQLPSLELEAILPEVATETQSKMSDPESEALPVPKGSYNIDWDNFDENTNPFESKTKVSNGPIPNKNKEVEDPNPDPFKPKKKTMMHSPPTSPKSDQTEDPFQSKNKMAASPKPSPAKTTQESADINQNVETPTKASPMLDDLEEVPREGGPHDLDQQSLQDVEKKSPRKKPTPVKKVPKRFKPPARFTQNSQASEDIEIFAPPPPKTDSSSEDTQIESKPQPISHSSPEDVQRPKDLDEANEVNIDDDEFRSATEGPSVPEQRERMIDSIQLYTRAGGNSKSSREGGVEPYEAGRVFNDPATWDMLEKFGSANNSEFKESALARQSLYVKFDPLVKGQSPVKTARIPSAEAIPEGEESLLLMGTPPPNKQGRPKHPAARVLEEQISAREMPEDTGSPNAPTDNAEVDRLFTCSPAEMMMIGSNEMTESREQTIKPLMTSSWLDTIKDYSELEGDSAVFSQDSVECLNWNTQDTGRAESPLRFDHEEVLRIDSSMEVSSRQNGASPVKQNDTMTASTDSLDIVHVLKYSQSDLNRIKKDMELDYQSRVLAKERDLQKQQKVWEKQKGTLDDEVKNLQKKNVDMKTVVSEYEMTMTQLIADKESSSSASKESMADLVKERDQALEDLHNVETAFSDLHRRFEKSKAAIEGFKKNEDTFKKCINDQQQKMKKQEEKYQALKKHAEDKLEQANSELERVRKTTLSEISRMQAAMKRAELQIQSLEQQVEQKAKENKELTAICDELINKVDQ